MRYDVRLAAKPLDVGTVGVGIWRKRLGLGQIGPGEPVIRGAQQLPRDAGYALNGRALPWPDELVSVCDLTEVFPARLLCSTLGSGLIQRRLLEPFDQWLDAGESFGGVHMY